MAVVEEGGEAVYRHGIGADVGKPHARLEGAKVDTQEEAGEEDEPAGIGCPRRGYAAATPPTIAHPSRDPTSFKLSRGSPSSRAWDLGMGESWYAGAKKK